MELLIQYIDASIATALTWTILHSVWQATLISLLMSWGHRLLSTAASRYLLSVSALLMVLVCSVGTFIYYYSAGSSAVVEHSIVIDTSAIYAPVSQAATSITDYFVDHSSMILAVWLGGMVLFLLKLVLSLILVQRLRTGTEHPALSYSLSKIRRRLRVTKPVSILESSLAATPVLVGHLKPIILFPIGLVNTLTTEEVEGIIAHELAHVMRSDYLVNILQCIVEAIYYYHPAVWWITANIKLERENCCDDIALAGGISPVTYSTALVKLQELSHVPTMSLAMAASGDRHQLLNRIKRILNMNHTKRNIKEKSIATATMLVVALLFSSHLLTGNTTAGDKETNSLTPQIDLLRTESSDLMSKTYYPTIDTLPRAKSRISIQTDNNGKSMSMIKEDGEIVELKIDGKTIDPSEYHKYEDQTDDVIMLDGNGGSRMMFFNHSGDIDSMMSKHFMFDFDSMFDQGKMQDLIQRFEGMEQDFAFPDIENLGDMMEKLGGRFHELRLDTMFELGEGDGQMRFFFDDDSEFPGFEGLTQRPSNSGKVSDIIGAELNRDGLLEPYKQNQVELTGKYLKINGEKQPTNIWGKYKRLYEDRTGMMMSKRSRIDFSVEGKKSTKKIRSF